MSHDEIQRTLKALARAPLHLNSISNYNWELWTNWQAEESTNVRNFGNGEGARPLDNGWTCIDCCLKPQNFQMAAIGCPCCLLQKAVILWKKWSRWSWGYDILGHLIEVKSGAPLSAVGRSFKLYAQHGSPARRNAFPSSHSNPFSKRWRKMSYMSSYVMLSIS